MVALRGLGGALLASATLALACGGESFSEGEAGGKGGSGTGGSSPGTGGKSTGGTGATGGTGMGAVGGTGGTGMGAIGGTGGTGMGAIGGTGNVGAIGGTGNAGAVGGTGMGAIGGTGNVGARGGTGGSGGGIAGASCMDPDANPDDPSGITTPGTTTGTNGEFMDSCDADGNLVEYFCETSCTTAKQAPLPPADGGSSGIVAPCYTLGTVGSMTVTCPEVCAGGSCVPLRR